jgi:beta-glucanase (GH16 family)
MKTRRLLFSTSVPALLTLSLPLLGHLSRYMAPPGVGMAFLSVQPTAFPKSDPLNHGGWTIYQPMSDDFNGTSLDPSKWKTNIAGWPGRPPALFVAHDVEVSNGTLRITMRKEPDSVEDAKLGFHDYTTGAVQSTTTVLYGYFEVRAKAMKSAGSSGFWLAFKDEKNWNEIDVFEMGGRPPANPKRVFMSGHIFMEDGVAINRNDTRSATMESNVADGFHTYGLNWSPDSIEFFIDGRLRRHLKNTSWHVPATIILDAEIQGDWWGLPKDSDLPSVFFIDYVRAWKKAPKGQRTEAMSKR